MDANKLAEIMRSSRPDRGNTYSTRTYKTKGRAQYDLWKQLVRQMAVEVDRTTHMAAFEFYNLVGLLEEER